MLFLILIGLIPSYLMAWGIVSTYEERAVSLRSANVKNQCDILSNQMVQEDYMNNPNSENINSQLALLSNVYNGRIMIIDSDFKIIKDTYDLDVGRISVSEEVVDCFKGNGTTQYDDKNNYIELTI